MRSALRVAALLAGAIGATACDMEFDAKVDGALLPQASGVVARSGGPTVVVKPGAVPPTLPAGPVDLAVDHAVPWAEIDGLLDRSAGAQPTFLVGQRQYVKGFRLDDHLALGPALRVRASAGGRFCLSPPGTDEAYCVESGDRQHISAVFVRSAMRKAVAEYEIRQARVVPDPDVRWADLVRTVDGVRTCCDHAMPVRVAR